jgi:4-amino-4-deoxy-L-arabinose transferase-like glycosyltransferase
MLYFGNNELTLRFIPALLGSLTIPLFYILGKEFFDRNAGIIAAAVLAFSQFHILYSQDARAYTTVLFFFSIALIFYMKALRTNDIRAWVLSGIFSGLAFWTHFYVFIIITGLYLFAIILMLKNNQKKFSQLKNPGLSIVAFLIVTLPLLIVTINLFMIRTGAPPTYGIQGFGIITESIRQMLGYNIIPEIVLIVLFLIGLFQAFRTDKMKFSLISAMIVLTFIASYFLSFAMPMIPRYLIFILPLFFVTIGYSYLPLWTFVKDRRIVYGLLILMVLISIPGLSGYYTQYTKEDWRGMAGVLQQATVDGDVVVVLPSYIEMPLTYYYSNQTDHTRLYTANTIAELENINRMKGNNSIYYIITPDISAVNPSGEVVAWMQANTQYAGERAGIYIFFLK